MAANFSSRSSAHSPGGQAHKPQHGATCPYCCHVLDLLPQDAAPPSGIRPLGGPEYPPGPPLVRSVCRRCRLLFEGDASSPDLSDEDRQRVMLAGYRARRAHDRFRSGREERFRAVGELAEAFVGLQGAPGVRPFCAATLDGWATQQLASDALRASVAFILHVADASRRWNQRFDVGRALQCWDTAQRAVFVEWARRPWWA